MTIRFYIRFRTNFGQTLFVSGNIEQLGNDVLSDAFALSYLNDDFWYGSIELSELKDTKRINYRYLLREDGSEVVEGEQERVISGLLIMDELVLVDAWNHAGNPENSFFTKPFREVLLPGPSKNAAGKKPLVISHEFRVKAPLLKMDEVVCISGSGRTLNDWNTTAPLLLTKKDAWFTMQLNLSGNELPLSYKYGVFNSKEKKFVEFEAGPNRSIDISGNKALVIIHDGFIHISRPYWKGAGIAIPVFSLRSNNSFGVGEFNDIRLLVDWAKQTSLKMIQILPVNDTTSTNSWQDSYPYSAISAFALHPLYLNLETVAGEENRKVVIPLKKKQKRLNELAEVDYEQVMKFKLLVLRELFHARRNTFVNENEFVDFFELNRGWLVPYAAFSYLRDKYKTADFSKWKTHSVFNEVAIQKFVSPSQKHYEEILFQYFIQYHLHLQLLAATRYAHRNGVILKGDIPIGISRNSVDAWIAPRFFHMDQQAGAPPDDFAVKGQNWGFPTYNWKKMQEDGYSWWRKRFEQMSNYFDAFRIDHILGFFRIWSIPINAVEGILGKFVPAIPIHPSEFDNRRIWFGHARYCNPFINDQVLESELGDQVDFVKENFLDPAEEEGRYKFKPEFNTQEKIEDHIAEMADDGSYIRQGLFNILTNVILIEEKDSQGQQYHFRIGMDQTYSYKYLDIHTQQQLEELYINYFFSRQDELWKKEALQKLPGLKRSTNMLICGEDLGMVPACVPDVMQQLAILSLEIQRMPKDPAMEFFHPKNAHYLSVVTPSTHDMSTIRGWWEEDRGKTQKFYNNIMGHLGEAPFYCEPWVNREIIIQHLYSPAMWSVFQMQDLLGMSNNLRRENPNDERINQPSDPKHYWRYRVHIPLEILIKEKTFNEEIRSLILASGRA